MNTTFGRLLATDGPGGANPGGRGWRSVPRINLLPPRRPPVAALLSTAFAAALVIEAVLLVLTYNDLSNTRQRTDAARASVARAEGSLTEAEADLASLYERVGALEKERKQAEGATTFLAFGSLDWGSSLAALFGAEVPGIRLRAVTSAGPREVQVSAQAADVESIGRFQSHIRAASSILDLLNLEWTEGDASLDLTATVKLLQLQPGR